MCQKSLQMNGKKRLRAVLCALLIALLLCAFLANAFAAEGDPFVETRQITPFSNPIADGQFAGAAGAEWTLYDDGTLVVESGNINRNVTVSLWAPWADEIERIVFAGPITAGPNVHSLFRGLTNLERIEGLEYFDVSGVTGGNGMHGMFQDTPALTYISDLSGWDTSNVQDMRNMFMRTGLQTIDGISGWDVSSVVDMRTMFQHSPNLTSLDLSSWNPASVQAMQFMFANTPALTTVGDLSNWDTGSATTMQAMFQDTPALTNVGDLSNWDTSNVTTMNGMFARTGLTTVAVYHWDVSNVLNMQSMFQQSPNLTSLDLSNWNPGSVATMHQMFMDTPVLANVGDLSNWDTSSVVTMQSMFQDTPALASIPGIASWNTSSVTTMTNMFLRAGVTSLDLSAWDTSSATAMGFMFADSALTSLDVSTWNTSNVTAMNTIFRNTALEILDLSNWDTSSANMANMFQGMTDLRVLTLGEHWIATGNPNLPAIPVVHPYTGRWQNVADGTIERPAGELSYTSSQLMTESNGTSNTWVWERIAITVTFTSGANGTLENGTPDVAITVPYGTILTAADIPTPMPNPGWVFSSWTASNPLGHTVTEDITFTAVFIADSVGTPPPPPPPPPPLPRRDAYLIGYDGLIRPNANITRAEVATIFFRVISDDMRAANWSQTNLYPDVVAGDWFNTAVSTTTQLGIFQGRPDGTFAPNQPITRAELAAVITRFMDVMGMADMENDFFNDIAGHWANGYINVAALNNWVRGPYGHGGAFYPDQPITRAETAAMVNRIFERLPETPADLLPDMVTWPDNADEDEWYYLYIQAASNSYTFTRRASGYENWVEILPVRDWVAIEQGNTAP